MALVNISTYGVRANSGQDETARINAAIIQAQADGNDLNFDQGDYLISGNIRLENSVSIHGSTSGLTRIYSNPANTAVELNNEGGNRAQISDLEISNLVLDNVVIDLSNRVTAATVRDNIIHNSDAQTQIALNGGTFEVTGNILLREEPWDDGSGVQSSPSRGVSLYKTTDTVISGNVIGGLTQNGENSTIYTDVLRDKMAAFAAANPTINLYDAGHYTTNIKVPSINSDIKIDHNIIVGASENDFDRDHAIYAGGYTGLEVDNNYFAGFYNDASGGVKLRNGEDTYVYNNYFDDISLITYTYDNHSITHFKDSFIFNNTFKMTSSAGIEDEKDPIYYIENNDLRPDNPLLTLENFNVYNNVIDAPYLRDVFVSVEQRSGEVIGTEVHVFGNTDTTHYDLEIEATAVYGETKTPFPVLYDRIIDPADIARMDALAAAEDKVTITGAPVFNNLGRSFDYTEGDGAVLTDSDATISDSNYDGYNGGAGNYNGANLTVKRFSEYNPSDPNDIFSFAAMAGITVTATQLVTNGRAIADYSLLDGVLTVTFTSANGAVPTTALVNQIIQSITYENLDQSRPLGDNFDFPIYYSFDDGTNTANGAIRVNLIATDSNDVFNGSENADEIDAGVGDDTVRGFDGQDTLNGGDGNDRILGDTGVDIINGGSGSDVIYGGSWGDLIKGSAGKDFLSGDAGSDTIQAGSNSDTLRGGDHSDVLLGGDDHDQMQGGAGDDFLDGEAGDDTLYGADGNDFLHDASGDNHLDGGSGNDILSSGDGNNRAEGGEGDDLVLLGNGANVVSAGTGNDQVILGRGNNFAHGGTGNDTIISDLGNDDIRGGDDNDILRSGAGADSLYGGSGDDKLVSSDGNDSLDGNVGDDTLIGGAGIDTISGGDDNDYMDGGTDNDVMRGGSGFDTMYGRSGNDYMDGGDGGGLLRGGTGTDHMIGGNGRDVLLGGNDNDTLNGNAGNDQLLGGHGVDRLYGGVGDDQLRGGDGNDVLKGEAGNDMHFGGDGNDFIEGGHGNDVLIGGAGNDGLKGEAGNDLLISGTGTGSLNGGDGDDTVLAGTGDDTIIGGTGIDHFVVTADAVGHGVDRFSDFSFADGEKIQLVGFGVNSTADFNSIFWNGSTTVIDINGSGQLRVSGVNLVGQNSAFVFSDTNVAPILTGTSNIQLGESSAQTSFPQLISNVQLTDVDTTTFENTFVEINSSGDVLEHFNFELGDSLTSGYFLNDEGRILLNGSAVGQVAFSEGFDGIQMQIVAPLTTAQMEELIESVRISLITDTPPASQNFNIHLIQPGAASSNTISATVAFRPENDAPVASFEGLWDQAVNEKEVLAIDIAGAEGFIDPDGDSLTFQLALIGGAALPDWMSFDGTQLVVSPGDYDSGPYTIRVTAFDDHGARAFDFFDISVGNTSYATMGVDELIGTNGNDSINGFGASDRLFGEAGADLITGGNEVGRGDFIVGGTGDDTVFGEAGQDKIYGQEGDDSLSGGGDNDSVVGNDGNDTIDGGAGADRLFGYNDSDLVIGGSGNDYMKGGSGQDTMIGGTGGDLLSGDDGDDSLVGDAGADRIFGGLGRDTLYGGDDHDRLSASDGTDFLNGQNGNDQLFGGLGSDTLLGSDGYDYIKGGDGNDIINGGAQSDRLYGGNGADVFVFNNSWGADRVFDWSEADVIDMRELGLKAQDETDADAFAKLTLLQSGQHLVLRVTGDDDNSIVLDNTQLSVMDSDDFFF